MSKIDEAINEENQQKIISDLCDMIKCRTVSNSDDNLVDWNEFEKFRTLLKERFPTIYSVAEFQKIGKSGIVHKISSGKADSTSDKNHANVLMAHYDVVPVEEKNWDFPPFAGDIENNFIRGRGTLDTKSTLCACMEAVELKLKSGWKPKKDLYLCFSGEEEINGESCSKIVDYFREKNIQIDFVLDEGGAIVSNPFPGVTQRCAMIGTAEKGSTYMDVVIEGHAGHASAPPKRTAVGIASMVASEIENHSQKAQFTKSVKNLLKTMGKSSQNGAIRFLFSNLFITKPLVKLLSKIIGGELNALLHTTCALTMLEGSQSYNVLPSHAKIGLNLRLLGNDTVEKAKARIERYASKAVKKAGKIGKKTKVSVNVVSYGNPSAESDTNCPQWDNLCNVIHQTWSDILISEYMMMACSDSRHYCRITDKVYRFSGMYLSKEERGMIHGINEKISCQTMIETVYFYMNLVETL